MESKVEGFEELFKVMDELAEEIGTAKTNRIWKGAMAYAMLPVLQQARNLAPVDSGQLADHIYMKVQKPQGRDKKSASYQGEAIMARVTVSPKREDSVAREVLQKSGKFRTYYTNRPVGLAMEFGNAHNGAKPFLRPALESQTANILARLQDQLWKSIFAQKAKMKD